MYLVAIKEKRVAASIAIIFRPNRFWKLVCCHTLLECIDEKGVLLLRIIIIVRTVGCCAVGAMMSAFLCIVCF